MAESRTQNAPASMYRSSEGLGLWEHRGKVAIVGVGVSPTARRWDGSPETSVGAWSILAMHRALEDAGVSPEEVDGLVMTRETATGSPWPEGDPIPEDFTRMFKPGVNPLDGITGLSSEWILNNMPELTNVDFTMYGPGCISRSLVVAAQAVGDGLTDTCLVMRGWHNLSGRYYVGQAGRAANITSGLTKWSNTWGTVACYPTAMWFDQYCRKYGKTHEMHAPFVVNSKRNGLLFPEGYWAQHRPEPLTVEDYLSARWIAKPANLYDNDIPICVSSAFLVTTPERARDMKQKPVYILNHTSTTTQSRSTIATLEEAEASTDSMGRKTYEGAGIGPSDLSFENMYDGFAEFHQFHIEGLRYAGIKRGEALDLYETDISIEGPNPVSPSGGNIGSGRTRFWCHVDSVQQLQGRAGARQISKPAEIGVTGTMTPMAVETLVLSSTPG
jgi:acetyl-CoA acetyltransferase